MAVDEVLRIGDSLLRLEDEPFLIGSGAFTDDLSVPGMLYGVAVRSPHAHARIGAIDLAAAAASDGVRLVLTAANIEDEVAAPLPSYSRTPPFDVRGVDGEPAPEAAQHPLAQGTVRYAGEPVAFVVADSLAAARDGAEQVMVDYEPLPAVMSFDQVRAAPGSPVWDDVPDNVSFRFEIGDEAAVAEIFESAACVVETSLINNRVVLAYMEPRAALAVYDVDENRFTLHTGCQSAHGVRNAIAEVLGLEHEQVRVIVPDTGGGFGGRGGAFPEFVLALIASRRLGQPVKWTAERWESFLSDAQSRDHELHGALALDGNGRMLAMRAQLDWRHGGYLAARNMMVMRNYLIPTQGGAYRIPAGLFRLQAHFSNTTPLSAYRGIGRVESNYLIESLVDKAARVLGLDRIEIRRRNLLREDELPWVALGGGRYTSGAFVANLDAALDAADWDGFAARRTATEAQGRLRGIGAGVYVENDGGVPSEFAEIEAHADGSISALVGTQDFGMAHTTFYTQVLSETLGVPGSAIKVEYGDTDRVARGFGSSGSRSARIGGGAAVLGARDVIDQGKALAADMLEAALADIDFREGRFVVAGTDRSVTLTETAAIAANKGARLVSAMDFTAKGEVHATGVHVCEVIVDPETGSVEIVDYTIVADTGRVVNPMIVEGQMHGGAAQGLGQAALERIVYDEATGQTLTGSFMDYALPRADDLPSFRVAFRPIVEADNPLGIKGAGESATSGAPGAFMNAVRDAIASGGGDADVVQMPATPEHVWRAIMDTG